jgi:hypothetical protein
VDEYFNGTGRYEKPAMAILSPFGAEDTTEEEDGAATPRFRNILKFPIKKSAAGSSGD